MLQRTVASVRGRENGAQLVAKRPEWFVLRVEALLVTVHIGRAFALAGKQASSWEKSRIIYDRSPIRNVVNETNVNLFEIDILQQRSESSGNFAATSNENQSTGQAGIEVIQLARQDERKQTPRGLIPRIQMIKRKQQRLILSGSLDYI